MRWNDTALTRLLGIDLPLVQAPMAGGYSTPALVAAVSNAGGLGSLAGAGRSPAQLRDDVAATRALTARPFAVNLFAPLPPPRPDHLQSWAELTAMPLPTPVPGPDFAAQLAALVELEVPILSWTFGNPDLPQLPDSVVRIGTATNVDEARALQAAGAHVVIAQGFEAGGHRGAFLAPPEESMTGTLALVPQILDAVTIPVVAAGGIMDGRGIAAALVLGAAGVALGTAFLCCPEAGTTQAHRAAIDRPTTVTKVLTGRHARTVRTDEIDRLEAAGQAVPDFPLPRLFLREPPMLTGQGGPLARELPAADLMAVLVAETSAALARLR
ncbi:MAG: NAD(P)H-dependent flavin oxidoreductase [Sporichthyaceae bacterium]